MLVFLGDFKPDYLDPTLPFESDDYPIVNLECAISDSDDERASKAYSVIVKLRVLDALSNYSSTMVSVASNQLRDADGSGFETLISSPQQHPDLPLDDLSSESMQIIQPEGLRCAIIEALEPCGKRRA